MKLIFDGYTFQVFKSSNSFGDLILKFVTTDGGDYFTLTYEEGSWPELTEDFFRTEYRNN